MSIGMVKVVSNRYAPRVRAGEVLTAGMGTPETGDDVLVRLQDGSLVLAEWPLGQLRLPVAYVALVTGIYAVRSGLMASEELS